MVGVMTVNLGRFVFAVLIMCSIFSCTPMKLFFTISLWLLPLKRLLKKSMFFKGDNFLNIRSAIEQVTFHQ